MDYVPVSSRPWDFRVPSTHKRLLYGVHKPLSTLFNLDTVVNYSIYSAYEYSFKCKLHGQRKPVITYVNDRTYASVVSLISCVIHHAKPTINSSFSWMQVVVAFEFWCMKGPVEKALLFIFGKWSPNHNVIHYMFLVFSSKWTDEEVDLLRKAVQRFGNDLEKVTAAVKTRTMYVNCCVARHFILDLQ